MANPQTSPQGFTPFFKRVSQGEDRHADIYACIAILTNKTIADIQQQAESLGVPKVGPFYPYLDGDLLAKILVGHNLVATLWKGATGYNDLPDVAIAMVDYSPEWEVGRCVVFHRQRSADGKSVHPYVVDPYPHADSKLHLRQGTSELNGLSPSWFIGVHPKPTGK
ncbi:hypothetical protein [Limnohabitans sp.]|uniref:hypothetical protein n=1 Tax=Limnohabitans sp. TaxID=1907725 RepID=UPI00286ED8B3|nr:hypothetical protein [Limnohabitans sp.]